MFTRRERARRERSSFHRRCRDAVARGHAPHRQRPRGMPGSSTRRHRNQKPVSSRALQRMPSRPPLYRNTAQRHRARPHRTREVRRTRKSSEPRNCRAVHTSNARERRLLARYAQNGVPNPARTQRGTSVLSLEVSQAPRRSGVDNHASRRPSAPSSHLYEYLPAQPPRHNQGVAARCPACRQTGIEIRQSAARACQRRLRMAQCHAVRRMVAKQALYSTEQPTFKGGGSGSRHASAQVLSHSG